MIGTIGEARRPAFTRREAAPHARSTEEGKTLQAKMPSHLPHMDSGPLQRILNGLPQDLTGDRSRVSFSQR